MKIKSEITNMKPSYDYHNKAEHWYIEKSRFRSFTTKILLIGPVLKLKINTIILKIFYAVESDVVLRTTYNRVAKKNTQTVTADTILANLDKGFDS